MRFQYPAIVMAVITVPPSSTDAFATVVNTKRYSLKNNHQHGYNINSNNGYNSKHNNDIVSLKASLRDLLGTPDDNANNDSDPSSSKKLDTSNADNFNNMLQPQRRNFQGLPSSSSEDGTDGDDDNNDELGLNMDRLRAFSFAGQIAPENTRVKKRSQQQQQEQQEERGGHQKKNGDASSNSNIDDDTVRANDFHQMINVSYSKKQSSSSILSSSSSRYPITQQISSANIDQETGMHIDKISTFSFSSSNTRSKYDNGRTKVVSGSNGSNSLREDSWMNRSVKVGGGIGGDGLLSGGGGSGSDVGGGSIGGESREERQKRMKEEVIASAEAAATSATTAAAAATTEESNDDNENIKEEEDNLPSTPATVAAVDIPMKVDNFHNMVNVDMSKNTGLKRLISSSTPDGEVNHADRMATFSLLSTEKDDDDDVGAPPPDILSDNHGDRLGTFSFASGGGGGGGSQSKKNMKKTVKSAPIVKDESEGSKAATITAADNDGIVTNESYSQVYTPPQKGSLSSLASSLATKTRVDRIQEIKTLTDPKLLHPDGMNVPRLNAKGDVMSMSSTTGRKNIFERIDSANLQEGSDGTDDVKDEIAGGMEGDEEKEEDISNGNDSEKDGDDEKKDAVGKAGAEDSTNDDRNPTNNVVDGNDLDENLESGDCFIGFDLGTSGARMSIVKKKASGQFDEVVTEALTWDNTLQYDNANDWRKAIDTLLSRAKGKEVMDRVRAICVSGTSATCLLVKRHSLEVSRKARMYNFDVKAEQSSSTAVDNVMKLIDKYVPEKHTARATTGTLAKLLLWSEEQSLEDEVLCHQSDYVSLSLMYEGLSNDDDITTHCDFHNILKLGYDVRTLEYPSWMMELLEEGANIPNAQNVLPSKVISPGEPIGVISPVVAAKYGLSTNVVLVGGTTDSNAAFFAAAGANPDYGTAVTSLGSTLAIKQLSSTYVEDASRGVYSHRFPRFGGSSNDDDGGDDNGEEEAWLIGGASNVGCAVLRAEGFTNEELSSLSLEIDPNTDSPLSYYPLIKTGERFPMADSTKEPILRPKPDSRKEYLHGILQGIGNVERDGFKVLGDLGATPRLPKVVLSCGGGSKNDMWIAMRQRRLKEIYDGGDDDDDDDDVDVVVVKRATNTEASYGAALLAAATFGN